MCVGVRDGMQSKIEVLGFAVVGRRALSAVFGVVKEWGKGRSIVEQDNASAVQCRRSVVFSNFRTAFSPLQGIWSGQRHSTAKIASERVVPRLHFECFWHKRRPVLKMLGPVIAVAFLVPLGRILRLRISLTDSAAPAGIYRIVPGVLVERGQLVGACLPPSIAQEGLARGYLSKGDCPGGAEPVAKIIGALPGDILEVLPGWVSVDGTTFADSAVAARDSIGRPLRHVSWGTHQVAPSEVWLFGFNNARSWDARYFGPVPLSGVRGVLQPILAW